MAKQLQPDTPPCSFCGGKYRPYEMAMGFHDPIGAMICRPCVLRCVSMFDKQPERKSIREGERQFATLMQMMN